MIGAIGATGRLGLSRGIGDFWTPALWLDAADAQTVFLSGSTVSQWNDKSANGVNLSQAVAANQPLYVPNGLNGLPIIRNVSNDFLVSGANSIGRNQSSLSVFAVVKYGAGTPSLTTALVFVSQGTLSTSSRMLMGTAASASGNLSAAGRRLDADTFQEIASPTAYASVQGQWIIQEIQFNYAAGRANAWVNGIQTVTEATFQTPGNTSDTNSLATSIFGTSGGANFVPNGTELAEVMIAGGQLSTSARQMIRSSLARKWALY